MRELLRPLLFSPLPRQGGGTRPTGPGVRAVPLLAGVLVVALLAGVTAGAAGPWAVALLGPVYVAVCVAWPAIGVAGLIVACALDRIAIAVGGPNVRPDELAALALAAALIIRFVLTPRQAARPSPPLPLLLPVLAYWGANVLSTVTSGGDLARGFSLDLLTLDLVILYLVLAGYLTTPRRLLRGVQVWLGVAAIEASVGMLAFALYLGTHNAVFGVQLAPDTNAPMVYGTLYEANIFGSYMGASFLIALALATEETMRRKTVLYAVCAATALGLLLSATRSAWGGTVLGALLLLALLRTGQGGRRSRLGVRFLGGLVAIAVVLGVGLAVAPASVTGQLGARVQQLVNFGSGSGYGRVLLYREAIGEWQAHPWLGLGPGSFSYRLPGDTTPGPAWLPNLTLQALHDTGIVGLLAMVWLFVAFYVITIRALRRASPGPARTVLAGLIAAVTTLLISFQLTPGFSLGYSWALLALAVAAASVVGHTASSGRREVAAA